MILIAAAGESRPPRQLLPAGAVGILTLVFCWKLVPETKGKPLEEIQAYFQARVKSKG